jgi:hypothetical protein
MKTFTVYHHPLKGFEAVREGFSWPGFFLTWIWAFFKGLPGIGWRLLLVWLAALLVASLRDPVSITMAALGILCVFVLVGLRGNQWMRGLLGKQGYSIVDAVHAESAEAAISKARRDEGLK